MIYYLTLQRNNLTLDWCFEHSGKPLASIITRVTYEELFQKRRVPLGTYIFSDFDIMQPYETRLALRIWERLAQHGDKVRLINHPTHSLKRYDFLNLLHDQGINPFKAYKAAGHPRPERFPVFIRSIEHGSLSPELIETQETLENALKKMSKEGHSLRDKLLVEFCDTRTDNVLFNKYSSFVIGNKIVPRSLMYGKAWIVREFVPGYTTEKTLEEERKYLSDNPHEDFLRKIFKLARIEYGRIDYSVHNGRMVVWEINVNPKINFEEPHNAMEQRRGFLSDFLDKFYEAFKEINIDGDPNVSVETGMPSKSAATVRTLRNMSAYNFLKTQLSQDTRERFKKLVGL